MAVESEYPKRQLIDILHRGHESKDLDYKGPIQWDEGDKKACCEIVKDVFGMANTFGGFIVIGVSEGVQGFSWDGLSADQLKTFETSRLNRFLQAYADPPINTLLRKVDDDGKSYVIIEVPNFPDTPHICQKDYPDVLKAAALYVRTDNNETAPIRSSADFRIVLERAVRNRGDTLLSAFRSILKTGSTETTIQSAEDQFEAQMAGADARFEEVNPLKGDLGIGYFRSSFSPETFSASRFGLEQLRDAAKRGAVILRGWQFLYLNPSQSAQTYIVQDGLETFLATKDFVGQDLIIFWRLLQSGLFYQRTTMRPNSLQVGSELNRSVLDFREVAVYVAEAINCLTRLYDGLLTDEDNVSFRLALMGTQNRLLVSSWPMTMPLWDDYTCRMPTVVVGRMHTLLDWRVGMIEHSIDISKEVYLKFNWLDPNVESARVAIEKMFARRW